MAAVYGNEVIDGALGFLVNDRMGMRSLPTTLQKYSGGDWTLQDAQEVPFGGPKGFFDWSTSPKTSYNFSSDAGTKLNVNYFSNVGGYINNNNYYSNFNNIGKITLTSPSSDRINSNDELYLSFTQSSTNKNINLDGTLNIGGSKDQKSTFNLSYTLSGNTSANDVYIVKNISAFYSEDFDSKISTNSVYSLYRSSEVSFTATSTSSEIYENGSWQVNSSSSNYKYNDISSGYSLSIASYSVAGNKDGGITQSGNWVNMHLKASNLKFSSDDLSVSTANFDAELNQDQIDQFNENIKAGIVRVDISDPQSTAPYSANALVNATMSGNNNIKVNNENGYFVDAGDGNDKITGNNGDDSLLGGNGIDTMLGGGGDDTYILLEGSTGGDIISDSGGDFDTLLYISNQSSDIGRKNFEMYSQGNDLFLQETNISNTKSSQVAKISSNNIGTTNKIEFFKYHGGNSDFSGSLITATSGVTTTGSSDGNVMVGTKGNDVLVGGDGDDAIFGSLGNDTLSGGDGDDFLVGGKGSDKLSGGYGNDNYRIDIYSGTSTSSAPPVTDAELTSFETITDYKGEDNSIDLCINTDQFVDAYRITNSTRLVFSLSNDTNSSTKYLTVIEDAAYIKYINVVEEDLWDDTSEYNSYFLSADPLVGEETDDILIGANTSDTHSGRGGNDILVGAGGNDNLFGGDGNDVIQGDAGADSLVGGTGDDVYYLTGDTTLGGSSDTVDEKENEGNDTVVSTLLTYTLGSNLENLILRGVLASSGTGNELENGIIGNSKNNLIDGGAGGDYMEGRSGNDTYIVDSKLDVVNERANEGVDTVNSSISYSLGANVEKLALLSNSITSFSGTFSTANVNNVAVTTLNVTNVSSGVLSVGQLLTYTVPGTTTNMAGITIVGFGTGMGGTGTYIVSTSQTFTTSSPSISISAFDSIDGQGNDLDNVITGTLTNNILDGGAGNDTLVGGSGDDSYIVDSSKDVVVELAQGGGIDTVFSSSNSWVMAFNVEKLIMLNNAGGTGIGNSQPNYIVGDGSDNTLDGKAAADTMAGGQGNDVYFVDNVLDIIVESANEGSADTINTSLSSYSIRGLINIENLTLLGNLASSATGNLLGNQINGNTGNNIINGLEGNDSINGNSGNDKIDGGSGNDNIIGGSGNDTLLGGVGNDWLEGGMGSNALTGGIGNDTFIISQSATDLIMDLGDSDILKINTNAKVDATLSANWIADESTQNNAKANIATAGYNVDLSRVNSGSNGFNITLTGTSADSIIGSFQGDTIVGGSSSDTISGGGGNDIINGGLGNDTLAGGDGIDIFVFSTGLSTTTTLNLDTITDFFSGTDKIQLSIKDIFKGFAEPGALSESEFNSYSTTSPLQLDSSDKVLYNKSDGFLYYDPDGNSNGNASAVAIKIAILGTSTNRPDLLFSDIQIIA